MHYAKTRVKSIRISGQENYNKFTRGITTFTKKISNKELKTEMNEHLPSEKVWLGCLNPVI